MKIDKSVQVTSIIVGGIIILSLMSFIFSNNLGTTSIKDTISVSGQASVDVVPNLVSVYFNIQTKGDTSSEASDSNTKIYESLKSSLMSVGFSESEIKTQSYNVYPDYTYENGKRKDNGFVATHLVKVEFSAEEKERISQSIDAGVSSGAGINSINFELSDDLQSDYKAQAIELASKDARTKADAAAKGLGKKTGSLVSVSVDEFYYYPFVAYAESSGTASTDQIKESASITPSSQEVSARVTAVFRIS